MPEYVPSVRMRRVARAIKNWRDASGLNGAETAKLAGWSAATQSRIDNVTRPISPAEVITLALIYRADEVERDAVFNSCIAAQHNGWWEEISRDALVADLVDFVELESEAATVRIFKVDLIPGLLQTAEYAEAVETAYLPRVPVKVARERVAARTQRQERLTAENPIQVHAVLTEAALCTRVGGPEVMREQLDRLVELAALPYVDLRVIPATGAYPAMGTPFSILSFATGYPDVGYIELLDGGVYVEKPEEVEPYLINFTRLQEVALSERKSRTLIADLARDPG